MEVDQKCKLCIPQRMQAADKQGPPDDQPQYLASPYASDRDQILKAASCRDMQTGTKSLAAWQEQLTARQAQVQRKGYCMRPFTRNEPYSGDL